jgi:hypothetical protein
MESAVEMSLGTMICIPIFIKVVPDNHKLSGRIHIDTYRAWCSHKSTLEK